jgi:hypothetical protein
MRTRSTSTEAVLQAAHFDAQRGPLTAEVIAEGRLVRSHLVLVLVILTLPGCGARSDLGEVRGRVLLDGHPLPDATVQFVPIENQGGPAYGRTDANGEYRLMYSRTVYGAVLGKNQVRITTADRLDEGGYEKLVPERVNAKYNRNSELVAVVEPGSQVIDFEVESVDPPNAAHQR